MNYEGLVLAHCVPDAVHALWNEYWTPPFSPGRDGDNDAIVRDAKGYEIADCRGNESTASTIAALLNHAAGVPPEPRGVA